MGALSGWIQQLGFLVLLASLVQLILPETEVRRAVQLVMGLVIVLAVVDPIVGWVETPDWPGSLGWEALTQDGEPFINAGKRLAGDGETQAEALWRRRLEQEIAALAILVDGVYDARVKTLTGSGGQVDAVEVALLPPPPVRIGSTGTGVPGADEPHYESGSHSPAGAHLERERVAAAEIRRLVHRLIPQVEAGSIRVFWAP